MSENKRVLVVIPAFNEAQSITTVIDGLRQTAPDYDRVIVNDGSTDQTGDVVARLGEKQLKLIQNLGYGSALQTGMKYALSAGYDVIGVNNGRDAQAAISNIEPVDVVLLDLMLPYISGYQLIEEIRDDARWQNVPIVVLSGKVLEEDIVQALDLGANDYVTKPFRPEELLARLRRIVADNERRMGVR